MNPFNWFSRPAWQSRDSARRADAVAHGRDPMLVAALPLILRQDAESSVRRAALERIDDLTLVADRMTNDVDAGLRERARARLTDLLLGKAPLAERQRALKLIDDQSQLENVAKRASEPEMRRAALERCTRAGFIAERCLDETDAELKLALLARIDARPTLERIAETARTRDKRLYKAVRERLDRERLAAGDDAALATRAEALCVRIEGILRKPGTDALGVLEAAEAEWAALRPRLDDRFDRRFAGAAGTLRATIGAISRIGEVSEPVVEPAPASAPESVVADPTPISAPVAVAPAPVRVDADPALQQLLSEAEALEAGARPQQRHSLQSRWNLQWSSESHHPEADLALRDAFTARLGQLAELDAARAAANEVHRATAETALAALVEAAEAGQLGAARSARARARAAIEAMTDDAGRLLKRQLAEAEPRLEKLAQWQRWSDNKVRQRLCEEVEALAGKGLHPDALASRVAELKAAWQKIDDSEADGGAATGVREDGRSHSADGGLGRRFRFLCHQVLEPAKPFFEKRREIRGKRGDELGEFMERAKTLLADENAESKALIELKRESADRLRRLDEIDPRQRGDSGKQLKQLIDALNKAVDDRFARIADEKQKLIAQLRRQLTHAELDASLDLAKAAQRRWQALPKGTMKSDQALWQEFRALVDPLFAKKVAEGNAVSAEREAERAATQALVDEVNALGDNTELDAAHLDAEITRIEAAWGALPAPGRDAERTFEAALAKARKLAQQRREALVSARADKVAALAADLDELERQWLDGTDASAAATELRTRAQGLEPAMFAALNQRLARIERSGGVAPDVALLEAQARDARRALLEYEFVAGVDSPAEEQQARLNLQVEKLAARMQSGQSRSRDEERAALDLRWWAIGPLAEREALAARRARART